jgi:hypothetical protein
MTQSPIAERMRNYFQRQLAWLDRWSAELPENPLQSDAEWKSLADVFVQYQKELLQLEEEFYLLERDWQAAEDITDAERSEITALAQKARTQADHMAQWFTKTSECAASERDAVEKKLQDFRQSSGAVRKYLGGEEGNRGNRVDRDA